MRAANLFESAAVPDTGETFETLLHHRNLVIERIISSSQPSQTEYVQAQDEWVALLQGTATLEIDGLARHLRPGDFVFLPAGTPHAVKSTATGTLWLAVHLHQEPASNGPELVEPALRNREA